MTIRQFLMTCDPGLEDIASAEIATRIGTRPIISKKSTGRLYVVAPHIEPLLLLRSIHRVVELKELPNEVELSPDGIAQGCIQIPWPELTEGKTFRVTCRRNGIHNFGSPDVERTVGGMLDRMYRATVKLKGWDYEICIYIDHESLRVGIAGKRYSLQRRFEKPFRHPTQLKSTVAYALLQLAAPSPGQVLVDPFCGGGSLLLEAAAVLPDGIKLWGSDLSDSNVVGAANNLRANGFEARVHVRQADARMLHTEHEPIDHIVTDLPFGKKSMKGVHIGKLYSDFLKSSLERLGDGGQLTLLTGKGGLLRACAQRIPGLVRLHQRNIFVGGLRLDIQKFLVKIKV